jgi:predicted PurR-regulated permease PerM
MSEASVPPVDDSYLNKVLESVVRVGLVLLLLYWCFSIVAPFITPVVWGVILAVAVFPAYRWLTAKLDGREKYAAAIFALLGIAVVLVPTMLFAGSLVESAEQVSELLEGDTIQVPPPPATVKDWPLIGEKVYGYWAEANRGLEPVLDQFAPQLREAAVWLLGATVGAGLAIGQSLLSIIIAAVLLISAPGAARAASRVSGRLAGSSGDHFTQMTAQTIRGVAVGIVGVAIIQASLVGVGLLVAGVPHAGVWSAVCLIFAILQLPPLIVVGPIIFYMFSQLSTPMAVAFMIWELAASMSDTFLKPILLARGVEVPMLVIFLGAIGGFMTSGFIGLFVGAVVLSLGYELVLDWLKDAEDAPEVGDEAEVEGVAG